MIDPKEGKFICTAFGKGREHDLSLCKRSKLRLAPATLLIADSGYQGIQNVHENSLTPKKASKNKPLTEEDKKENRQISSVRIKAENAFAFIKRFKIFSTRYRNRARRFGLRFNLFAAIANLDINLC